MKLHISNLDNLTLAGTHAEFAHLFNVPVEKARTEVVAFAQEHNLSTNLNGGKWMIYGSYYDFSNGVAKNLNDFTMSFKKLHPEVEITFHKP